MSIHAIVNGQHAIQTYDAVHGGRTVRIAEHRVVRDERIVNSGIVFYGPAFVAFFAGASPLNGS